MASPVAPEDKEILKQLAKQGAVHDHVTISSSQLAERLGVSQQTASRKILELLESGLIVRRMGTRKQHIRISDAGVDVLRRELADYRSIFQAPEQVIVRGRIMTGLGEGRYYISRDGYRKAFGALLGFDPYAGTLNIEVEVTDRERVLQVKNEPGLLVPEFQSEGRTFGAVKAFRATLGGIEAAVIFPIRSHHVNVIELISPHGLREKLGLTDGAEVEVHIDVPGSLGKA